MKFLENGSRPQPPTSPYRAFSVNNRVQRPDTPYLRLPSAYLRLSCACLRLSSAYLRLP